MVWNKQAECMSKEEKEKLQLERLQQTVKLAYNNVSFYKEKFLFVSCMFIMNNKRGRERVIHYTRATESSQSFDCFA